MADSRNKWGKTLVGLIAAMEIASPMAGRGYGEVVLAWDPNPEPDIAGYIIYYGVKSRKYDKKVDVGNVTSGSVNLEEKATYYFAATAYNTSGLESDFSNEVSFTYSGQDGQGIDGGSNLRTTDSE